MDEHNQKKKSEKESKKILFCRKKKLAKIKSTLSNGFKPSDQILIQRKYKKKMESEMSSLYKTQTKIRNYLPKKELNDSKDSISKKLNSNYHDLLLGSDFNENQQTNLKLNFFSSHSPPLSHLQSNIQHHPPLCPQQFPKKVVDGALKNLVSTNLLYKKIIKEKEGEQKFYSQTSSSWVKHEENKYQYPSRTITRENNDILQEDLIFREKYIKNFLISDGLCDKNCAMTGSNAYAEKSSNVSFLHNFNQTKRPEMSYHSHHYKNTCPEFQNTINTDERGLSNEGGEGIDQKLPSVFRQTLQKFDNRKLYKKDESNELRRHMCDLKNRLPLNEMNLEQLDIYLTKSSFPIIPKNILYLLMIENVCNNDRESILKKLNHTYEAKDILLFCLIKNTGKNLPVSRFDYIQLIQWFQEQNEKIYEYNELHSKYDHLITIHVAFVREFIRMQSVECEERAETLYIWWESLAKLIKVFFDYFQQQLQIIYKQYDSIYENQLQKEISIKKSSQEQVQSEIAKKNAVVEEKTYYQEKAKSLLHRVKNIQYTIANLKQSKEILEDKYMLLLKQNRILHAITEEAKEIFEVDHAGQGIGKNSFFSKFATAINEAHKIDKNITLLEEDEYKATKKLQQDNLVLSDNANLEEVNSIQYEDKDTDTITLHIFFEAQSQTAISCFWQTHQFVDATVPCIDQSTQTEDDLEEIQHILDNQDEFDFQKAEKALIKSNFLKGNNQIYTLIKKCCEYWHNNYAPEKELVHAAEMEVVHEVPESEVKIQSEREDLIHPELEMENDAVNIILEPHKSGDLFPRSIKESGATTPKSEFYGTPQYQTTSHSRTPKSQHSETRRHSSDSSQTSIDTISKNTEKKDEVFNLPDALEKSSSTKKNKKIKAGRLSVAGSSAKGQRGSIRIPGDAVQTSKINVQKKKEEIIGRVNDMLAELSIIEGQNDGGFMVGNQVGSSQAKNKNKAKGLSMTLSKTTVFKLIEQIYLNYREKEDTNEPFKLHLYNYLLMKFSFRDAAEKKFKEFYASTKIIENVSKAKLFLIFIGSSSTKTNDSFTIMNEERALEMFFKIIGQINHKASKDYLREYQDEKVYVPYNVFLDSLRIAGKEISGFNLDLIKSSLDAYRIYNSKSKDKYYIEFDSAMLTFFESLNELQKKLKEFDVWDMLNINSDISIITPSYFYNIYKVFVYISGGIYKKHDAESMLMEYGEKDSSTILNINPTNAIAPLESLTLNRGSIDKIFKLHGKLNEAINILNSQTLISHENFSKFWKKNAFSIKFLLKNEFETNNFVGQILSYLNKFCADLNKHSSLSHTFPSLHDTGNQNKINFYAKLIQNLCKRVSLNNQIHNLIAPELLDINQIFLFIESLQNC